MIFPNKAKYEGNWKNGRFHGTGYLLFLPHSACVSKKKMRPAE